MDYPFLHLYFSCSLLTTIAFLYLIFHFFVSNPKQIPFQHLPSQQIECVNDNIATFISDTCFSKIQENAQKGRESSGLTPTAKKIINNRRSRKICKDIHHRQCCYLPFSDAGLFKMKTINRKYIKSYQNVELLGLIKQKKKKNLSKCVKKYGFHKTTLVTIYEQLQY